MDVGLYLEYEVPEGSDPDTLEIKGLFEKEVKRFVNTANLIFERQVGSNASKDIELGYAWRTKYRLRTDFEPGLELYGDLGELNDWDINGDQNHQAGPVATANFTSVRRVPSFTSWAIFSDSAVKARMEALNGCSNLSMSSSRYFSMATHRRRRPGGRYIFLIQ